MDPHVSPSRSPSELHNNAASDGQSLVSATDTPPTDKTQDPVHQRTPRPSSTAEFSTPTPAVERHPKGKRKRTAVKDKAVLEAAYNVNPKPDKTARLELVKRVSLNEKEVQIWFQNRRQNDRRKSRPLSPQEIAALRYGGMQILSSDPIPYSPSPALQTTDASPPQRSTRPEAEPTSPATSESRPASLSDEADADARQGGAIAESSPTQPPRPSPSGMGSNDDSTQLSRSFPGSIGYLSNRWNPGSSFSTPNHRARDDAARFDPFPPSTCSSAASAGSVLPPPSSRSSQFRLSLSLEGKAEVVSSTVSPPRLPMPRSTPGSLSSLAPRIRRPDFQRSRSAQSPVTLPPISALTWPLTPNPSRALPPRLTRGRSRDVHAWEFCCDADNQEDPLMAQAKHESSGSATAVISLLRSTSSTGASASSPLQPSSSAKRNAPVGRASARPGLAKKPRLGRLPSSSAAAARPLGRSFGAEKNANAASLAEQVSDVAAKKSGGAALAYPHGGDSDKENWSPHEGGSPARRSRQHTPGGGRRPLPSGSAPSQPVKTRQRGRPFPEARAAAAAAALFGSRANTAPAATPIRGGKGGRSPLRIFEDAGSGTSSPPRSDATYDDDDDDEVERFMRGEVSPSKKGDVDAVAGLLSLSQGNWR